MAILEGHLGDVLSLITLQFCQTCQIWRGWFEASSDKIISDKTALPPGLQNHLFQDARTNNRCFSAESCNYLWLVKKFPSEKRVESLRVPPYCNFITSSKVNPLTAHLVLDEKLLATYAPINSKVQHPPPGKPPGIWTFEDWLVQIPSPWGKKAVQMPHQLLLKYLSSKTNFVFNQTLNTLFREICRNDNFKLLKDPFERVFHWRRSFCSCKSVKSCKNQKKLMGVLCQNKR